jgi:hypothetical protein
VGSNKEGSSAAVTWAPEGTVEDTETDGEEDGGGGRTEALSGIEEKI